MKWKTIKSERIRSSACVHSLVLVDKILELTTIRACLAVAVQRNGLRWCMGGLQCTQERRKRCQAGWDEPYEVVRGVRVVGSLVLSTVESFLAYGSTHACISRIGQEVREQAKPSQAKPSSSFIPGPPGWVVALLLPLPTSQTPPRTAACPPTSYRYLDYIRSGTHSNHAVASSHALYVLLLNSGLRATTSFKLRSSITKYSKYSAAPINRFN